MRLLCKKIFNGQECEEGLCKQEELHWTLSQMLFKK